MDPTLGIFFFAVLGILVALVWHPFVRLRYSLTLAADVGIGLIGAVGGSSLASFLDYEKRIFWVNGTSVAFGIAGAIGLLATSLWLARIPADA